MASIIGVPAARGDVFVALRIDDPRPTSNRGELRTDSEYFYFTLENRQSGRSERPRPAQGAS